METLDLLISKFKEVKEELAKDNSSAPLHSTVEEFMTGLKALPKGSAERGKFITQHMGHGPFISALNAHPQGKQMHTMLMGHLNSVAKSNDYDAMEELEKYFSPWTLFGSSRKSKPVQTEAAKPASPAKPAAPAKLTGSDKIAAVSKEKIQPTSVAATPKPPHTSATIMPPKLTGLDRIRAEGQRTIDATAVKVKKDEDKENDEDEKDDKKEDLKKGLFGMGGSKQETKKPFTPSFKGHNAALGVGASTDAKGVTTVRSFDPLKQETSQKKYINAPFGKTINSSYDSMANQSDMVKGCGEKLSLNKGGQWNLNKAYNSPYVVHGPSKPVAKPVTKPEPAKPSVAKGEDDLHDEKGRCQNCGSKSCDGQACKVDHAAEALKANAKQNEGFKNKIKGLCPKCHAKKCQCKKDGVLVD